MEHVNYLLMDVLPCVAESVELPCIGELVHEYTCVVILPLSQNHPTLVLTYVLLVAAFVHNYCS